MSVLSILIYRFNAVSIEIPANYFVDIDKLIIWKVKRHRIAKIILKKKNKDGGLILPDFKTYYVKLQ